MSTKIQLTPKASKEEYDDIAHTRDNFKISTENNLRIQMLRSIFKEYTHYLKQNKMSAEDIRLNVIKNVHTFLEKNKGYVNSTFLKLVQDDIELALITDKATLKEKIRQNFIKNVGPDLNKFDIQDMYMNNDFKHGYEALSPETVHSRTVAFCNTYYFECTDKVKNSCSDMQFEFLAYL